MCYTDSVRSVGVDDGKVPPVPIPNTVVKLVYGDNTWLATAREDNSTPTSFQTDPKGSVFCCLKDVDAAVRHRA